MGEKGSGCGVVGVDEAEGIIVTTTPFHPKEHLEMQFSQWLSGKSSATTIQRPEARNPNFLHSYSHTWEKQEQCPLLINTEWPPELSRSQ